MEKRQLFKKQGSASAQPVSFVQTGEEYIQSIHSRNGFSRTRMGEEAAATFDEEVRKLLAPYLQEGLLTLSVIGETTWGKPLKV